MLCVYAYACYIIYVGMIYYDRCVLCILLYVVQCVLLCVCWCDCQFCFTVVVLYVQVCDCMLQMVCVVYVNVMLYVM